MPWSQSKLHPLQKPPTIDLGLGIGKAYNEQDDRAVILYKLIVTVVC